MRIGGRTRRSAVRLFGTYVLFSLIPVVVLGVALAWNFQKEGQKRGLNEAQAQGAMFADTVIEPLVTAPLSPGSISQDHVTVLRGLNAPHLRLFTPNGAVVYSDDDPTQRPPSAADLAAISRAATGAPQARVQGNQVVIDRVLISGDASKPNASGVMEVTLPYTTIRNQVAASLHTQYRNLGLVVTALYLTLLAISFLMSRDLRQEVDENRHMAEHDFLTDLPNRTLFLRRAEQALKQASRERPVAIAIIDLDRFKDVNDTLGHHNGDELLAALADRLDVSTRPEDTVARLGGDEFGIILTDVLDAEEALWRLRKIIDQEIVVSSGLPLSVESSVGFVVAPEDGDDVDDLLQRADVAMYVAKGSHSGVVRYNPEQDEYDADNLRLMTELPRAIRNGELVLHYQPKVAINDDRVEAVEALVRWEHPKRGLLYPDKFVPIAEQTDLIDKLTDWALDQALADVLKLGRHNDSLAVAVNVSGRSLSKPDFAARVGNALQMADAPPARLIVEVTETALVTDPKRAGDALDELDSMGIRVSIDDFGQGQTSLNILSDLPVHELKIDKAFVCDMLDNPKHAAIAQSVIDLGHNLGMRVIGEGVETHAVLGALRATGCDVAQGFLIARPMPFKKLEDWLAERRDSEKRPRRRPLQAKRHIPVG